MYLQHLTLEQFRSYPVLDLDLPSSGFRIAGRNASGKSSLLEAIVMLSTTKSPRANVDRDIVNWESGIEYGVPPYSRLTGTVVGDEGVHRIGISIAVDAQRAQVSKKKFFLDQRSVRAHTLIGTLRSVLFSPEDVDLVSGPPSERRRQVDILISQVDRRYLQRLSRYARILTQRNGLLRRFARDGIRVNDIGAIAQLSFWDEELVDAGSYIVAARVRASASLATFLGVRSRELVDGASIAFAYGPKIDLPGQCEDLELPELTQRIGVGLKDQLAAARSDEFRRGMSTIGPHRDDFLFALDGRELGRTGSRGLQRLGVVAYKLAESDFIHAVTEDRPVLLLDDVLSELDIVHRDMLLNAVADFGCQVLVTATENALLDHRALVNLPLLNVEPGRLIPAPGRSPVSPQDKR